MRLDYLTACCLLAFSTMALAEETTSTETQEASEQEATEQVEAKVDLEIKGIKEQAPEAWDNVKIFVDRFSNEERDGSERFQYQLQQQVDKALRAKGYYNTKYQFVETPRAGKKPLLVLNVELDKERVKIDETEINITGQGKTDEAFEQLVKTAPKKGAILEHNVYDSFKSSLEGLAYKRGYFDAEWLYHRLEVYPKEHSADWRLGYDTGDRYHYGKITFKDSQIREDYLENILKIKSGDPYLANDLSTLTTDYSSSNWFSSVLVEPDIDEKNKVVDLDVRFYPRKKNDVEIGIGYATDDGPRLQLNWKKPWLNDRGHSLETNTYLSKPSQSFEFGYNIPVKKDPIYQYYQISGGIERENRNDTKSTAANLGFQRFWNSETGWSFSTGVKARYDAFTQGNDKFKTLLIYPTASVGYKRSDGNRFPLWGESHKLTVNWGNKVWLSDVNFYSAKFSTAWIRTFFDNHRFFLRGELGYMKAGEFQRIPPALRYFAGGDNSIRGFGYKNISPRDKDGKLTGGSHLMTATAEYQYQVYPNWWAAAFYDTGLAANDFKSTNLNSGVGVGVRWASPIGAVKFDIATPVRSPNKEKGIKFYIGLGAEL
ncbi:hypothetical protein B0187_05560 [Haemophilus paracuniculus]|uniref:Translocation and assembly module subunit TamA n=1 Tax=Haemophilus paracuniculus TaxID=734 RepID=A0A1T0ASM3_9PAST|nr:autotransporter assembly complex family protein [Haemophilus paracuniculus]OOR99225.1 hypothetical protein B0187_05560 [Haemophilus paracuniculus]